MTLHRSRSMNEIFWKVSAAAVLLVFVSAVPVLAEEEWEAPAAAAARKNPVDADAASIQRGKALFMENCTACHGSDAKGDGPVAPNLTPPPANLVEAAGEDPDGDFFWKIENGKGPMPGFKNRLSEKQVWDLVNYIQSLKSAH